MEESGPTKTGAVSVIGLWRLAWMEFRKAEKANQGVRMKCQKVPSNQQIVSILRFEIRGLKDSYTTRHGPRKGCITNPRVLYEIACLKRAIQIIATPTPTHRNGVSK